MVALGLWTLSADGDWPGIELVAQITDGYDGPAGDELRDEFSQFELVADAESAAEGPAQLFDLTSVATSDFAELSAAADVSTTMSGLEGRGLGAMGDVLGGGSPGEAEFFGIGGYGGSFVYVVDVSGSMSEAGKFERAREELLRSIGNLAYDQRYFVIFYNDGWYPMDADAPVPATADEVDKTRRWVGRIWPGGGTEPLPALLYALDLEPDAIYFLSDGRFDPATITALRRQNPRSSGQIPIHTIAFVNRETVGIMRSIARQSGGKFRFVK